MVLIFIFTCCKHNSLVAVEYCLFHGCGFCVVFGISLRECLKLCAKGKDPESLRYAVWAEDSQPEILHFVVSV